MDHCSDRIVLFLFCVFVRWGVSLNSYSGKGKGPLYGDYEAQRHWMEITYNLPTDEWYHETANNNLQYWGLDYPPLTAYHSLAMGALAAQINQSWVELHASRGIETEQHKLYMRYSALVSDVLIYFPAVFLYFQTSRSNQKLLHAATVLLYPGLILIDHGHFQYNSISLGLFVWAVIFLEKKKVPLGSVAFTLALNYKQMELYHAMPFFCYLLSSSFRGNQSWFLRLLKIGTVVILTFICCWIPFMTSAISVKQVFHRLFPFARGLYEDKVANVWCSLSVFIKLKQIYEKETLINICLMSTLLGLMPTSLHLLWRPSIRNFKYALVNSSLTFFLFSFQVHEKSILLATIPACLLLGYHPFMCSWFLIVSTFSMLPLLIKDGLVTSFIASTTLFGVFASTIKTVEQSRIKSSTLQYNLVRFMFGASLIGCTGLTAVSLLLKPPPSLPDLFAVLVSIYSCVHFLLFLAYFSYAQFRNSGNSVERKSLKRETKKMK